MINKRAIAKIGTISAFGVLVFLGLFLIILPVLSSENIKTTYVLGEKIKFDVPLDVSKVKVNTPTSSFVYQASRIFLFKPSELGNYKISIGEIDYSFTVVKSLSEANDSSQGISNSFKDQLIGSIGSMRPEYKGNITEIEISKQIKEVKDNSDEVSQGVYISSNISKVVRDKRLIKVYWKEENTNINFEAYDADQDGVLDTVSWEPSVAGQTYEIIIILKAEHLDENKSFIEDIYSEVSALDDIFKEVPQNHYVRVSFEQNLTSEKDITLYARSSSGARIEVYEEDSDNLIAEFENILGFQEYKVYLNNLVGFQDTFDLKVIGESVEFDYIVDPTTGGTTIGGLRPQACNALDSGIAGNCDQTYPSTCPTLGGSDYLSCNDANEETHSSRKDSDGQINLTYYNSSIINCVEITRVQACYEWRAPGSGFYSCYVDVDNDYPGSWSGVSSDCPGAGATDCADVTSNGEGWICSNFFGASGDRAKMRSGAITSSNSAQTVYWDQLWYNVTYTAGGWINATLNTPDIMQVTNKTIYTTFSVNATVFCRGNVGDTCGVINGILRYNSSSSSPDTQISTTTGAQPFFANLANQTCGRLNVTSSGPDNCTLVWTVNATQLGSFKIDVLFSSNFSSVVLSNDTLDANITVFNPSNLTINLSFPLVDPGISEGDSFNINCTANCTGQDCLNVIVYPIYCTGFLCTPNQYLTTNSPGINSSTNGVSLGTVLAGTSQNATFTIKGITYGNYSLSCNSTTSNDGNITLANNLLININRIPLANFTYPSAGDWLHDVENLNASASSDIDGVITNYAFEIDDNSLFATPTQICSGVSVNCTLNTSSQTECSQENSTCYLRLNVTDDDSTVNSTIIQIGIDNIGPNSTLNYPLNNSYIATESQITNATVNDYGSGISCLIFEFYNTSWNSIGTDCLTPYQLTWDLTNVPDQTNLQVRVRANDSEGNFGNYSIHENLTHDITAPIVVSNTPTNNLIINTTFYLLNASSSSDATSGIKNASWYWANATSSGLIGSNTTLVNGIFYNWSIDVLDGVYNISVDLSDNAGLSNSTLVTNITIDTQNDNPACLILYPNGGENISGGVLLAANASDQDPSDYVKNITFEYSLNNGTSWNLIGANTTANLVNYSLSWDTTLDSDSNLYLIRCNASDSRTGVGTDVSNNNFTVDNTKPIIEDEAVNETYVLVNSPMCLNASVLDNLIGIDFVMAEIDCPTCGLINLTLLDDGVGCDSFLGDNVYSYLLNVVYDGDYNWTKTYASDNLGNMNITFPGVGWTAYSNSYLISEMLYPTENLRINESGAGNNFTIECNVSCNSTGGDCYNVEISVEYEKSPGSWLDINTLTTDLVNEEDLYSCGQLNSSTADECIHIFNITSGENSGGNTWAIRCRGLSSNAAADFSDSFNIAVNNFPTANFTYPSAGDWLHDVENLNASASSDIDGVITNYAFEIDDNSLFATPTQICSGSSVNCTLNTSSQTRCSQENSTCYLRLNVTDDDSTINSTIIQIGIDNIGPNSTLNYPLNNSYITTEFQTTNATVNDYGSGISCLIFEFYNTSWNSIGTDCLTPYQLTWDLTSVPDQENLQVRVRANDSEGNFGNYSSHINLTHDTTVPYINLTYPGNNTYYNITTLYFNFTAKDNIANTMNCSLFVDNELKNFNSSSLNNSMTSFSVAGLSSAAHNWSVNCTDTAGNKNSSVYYYFVVDTSAPVVNLLLPQNNYWSASKSIQFNYTPIDSYLQSCQLWGNWSGGWHLNETSFSVTPSVVNTFNKNLSDGNYLWNVKCNDSSGSFAFNSSNYTLNVDTVFPNISYNPNTELNLTVKKQNWIFVNISASDLNKESVIFEWNGVNESFDFSSGNLSWENKTALTTGTYTFRVYVNDSAGNLNFTNLRTVVIDLSAPNWSNQNQTVAGVYSNIIHRGEEINLSAIWVDNINLSRAWLATNETGSWDNKTNYRSPLNFSGTANLSYFNWSNVSSSLGQVIGWKIYANDSSGNENVSDIKQFQVWGFSEVGNAYLSPAGIAVGGSTKMYCLVRDNSSLGVISGYNVSFYNYTGALMGTNITGTDGYAFYGFSVAVAGTYTYTCNMSNNASLYYNYSSNNNGQVILGVGYRLTVHGYNDTTDNFAYEGTTPTTTTAIDDPYTDLVYDDNNYQTYRSGSNEYAYSRFELKIDDPTNQIFSINMTWKGYGEIGNGSGGYVLFIYNTSLANWQQIASYSTNNAERTELINYTDNFDQIINSSGYLKILSRSITAGPSGGGAGSRWAEINNEYIDVNVYADILAPLINLTTPVDYYNSSSRSFILNCSVGDDYKIENVSLYGSWANGWHLNETNISKLNRVNYSFSKTVSADGTYVWNCYACDKAGNCGFAVLNRTFTSDTIAPIVNLIYPGNNSNFSNFTIGFFNFSVTELYIDTCKLYGDWNNAWHINKSYVGPPNGSVTNFSSVVVEGDEYYTWNVWCNDSAGNSAFNSTNYTFAAFLSPLALNSTTFNISQSVNNGSGNVTLYWNVSNHTYKYLIYAGLDFDNLVYLNETFNPNYTDASFSGNKRRFYRVDSWNPAGQNISSIYFGAHVYTLQHTANTRNWISFPTNFSYLSDANKSLKEITNATSFTMWNVTIQQRVTCNDFSCPMYPSCTLTCCNFNLEQGQAYEVNINGSAPAQVNWSGVGIVNNPIQINLIKNETSFGKNWISLYANTDLVSARNLSSNISNCDAVSKWNEATQTSQGLVYVPAFGLYVGTNFELNLESGYEVSVNQSTSWTQV